MRSASRRRGGLSTCCCCRRFPTQVEREKPVRVTWRIVAEGLAFMGRPVGAAAGETRRHRVHVVARGIALPERGIEASSCCEQYEFTIRAERMAGRGDVPQVPRRPLLGRRELAWVLGRLHPSRATPPPARPPPPPGPPRQRRAPRPAAGPRRQAGRPASRRRRRGPGVAG